MPKIPKTEKPAAEAKTGTTSYDVAEHLRTPGEMANYLDAWFSGAPEDSSGIIRALADIARAKKQGPFFS